jgi:hypothetical protein
MLNRFRHLGSVPLSPALLGFLQGTLSGWRQRALPFLGGARLVLIGFCAHP